MAKKFRTDSIAGFEEDWGGAATNSTPANADETSLMPYSGKAVQEFIKKHLQEGEENRIGFLAPVINEGGVFRIKGFASKESYNLWAQNPGLHNDLVLTDIALPFADDGVTPFKVIRDRGVYLPTETYYAGDVLRPETNDYEQSDVWYNGCRWRCMRTGTTDAPGYTTADWAFLEGDTRFVVRLLGGPSGLRPKNFKIRLTLQATFHNEDITSFIADDDITWTRYTEDAAGNQRTASDEAWNIRHLTTAKEIMLCTEDIDIVGGVVPPVAIFTATVRMRDMPEPVAVPYGYRLR